MFLNSSMPLLGPSFGKEEDVSRRIGCSSECEFFSLFCGPFTRETAFDGLLKKDKFTKHVFSVALFSSSVFRQKRSVHKTHTHFPLYFHLFNIFFILPPFPIQHFPTAAAAGFEQTSLLTEFQLTVECEAAAR